MLEWTVLTAPFRAAENGREVAQHMLCTLAGRPELTVTSRHSCVTLAHK